ncbi:SDR family NAD(P)-dependent oxidoreductase [Paenarthrobacter nicotinovorans]|uniref:SDR family NAD(P)-dependent oxidoreductase n=1 Tax=Paenarthrobacter nicotinovorans TaxID=29320 RepID=UPI000478A431|nr:SDR family NAD(P)-dependent oxidoreductase [Paenarthrobacter nicotinovorans]
MSTTERPLALVTGASSGIGFELARQFLSNGFDTVIVAENDKIHAAAAELKGLDGDAYAEQIDLTDTQGMARLHAAVAALGSLSPRCCRGRRRPTSLNGPTSWTPKWAVMTKMIPRWWPNKDSRP